MKKYIRNGMVTILIICVFILGQDIVYAGSALGAKYNVTVYGYRYTYYSEIETDGGNAWAYTHLDSTNHVPIPSGYMGCSARLYNESGKLIIKSDMTYSTNAFTSYMEGVRYTTTQRETFYSRGQVAMFKGDGYYTYTTPMSPYQQTFSARTLQEEYHVNDNNEIYGSEYILNQYNIEPDLISSVGDNNIEGYVKAVDLKLKQPNSPEEAIIYMENLPTERVIPLYESDGETVIGTFTIHND